MAKDEIVSFMKNRHVTVESVFVPWSKSRYFVPNAKIQDRKLNWRITVKVDGRAILETDFSAGIGHAPSYKWKPSILDAESMEYEVEHGMEYEEVEHGRQRRKNMPILPDSCDVLASLALDSDVLNYSSFEEWAPDFGYDSDSRAAEKIYNNCMKIALQIRNGLGEDGLKALTEAVADY